MLPTNPETAPAPAAGTPRASVLFVHIQKTAGMSLYNSLAQWFGAEHSLRYPRSSQEFKDRFLRLSDADILRFRLLSGHFELPFWLRRELGPRFVVSVVREPVERVLSIYRYARGWTGHQRHAEVARMSIADFVDQHVADTARHDWQCRKFCGAGDFAAALAMIERHVDLVGTVERMALLTTALGERLGVTLDLRRDNISPDAHPRREDLDPALLAKLLACNAEDRKLWSYVTERDLVRGQRG